MFWNVELRERFVIIFQLNFFISSVRVGHQIRQGNCYSGYRHKESKYACFIYLKLQNSSYLRRFIYFQVKQTKIQYLDHTNVTNKCKKWMFPLHFDTFKWFKYVIYPMFRQNDLSLCIWWWHFWNWLHLKFFLQRHIIEMIWNCFSNDMQNYKLRKPRAVNRMFNSLSIVQSK